MAETPAKRDQHEKILRYDLERRSYAKPCTFDNVTYIPTRSFPVQCEEESVSLKEDFIEELETLGIPVFHIQKTDHTIPRYILTFKSEEDMDKYYDLIQKAFQEKGTVLQPLDKCASKSKKGTITVAGLIKKDHEQALEFLSTFVIDPVIEEEYDAHEPATTFKHKGVKQTIKTYLAFGNKPFPNIIKTTHQSRHILDTIKELEQKANNTDDTPKSKFYIKHGVITHICAEQECKACEESY